MKLSSSFIAAVCLASLTLGTQARQAQAQPAQAQPIVVGTMATLHSKILDEERTLMVSLPDGYEGSDVTYPVLYLLDARTRFHHTHGTVASLARTGHIPEMIIVALLNTDRTRDLTPPWTHADPPEDRAQAIAAGGGADTFQRFLREELIPHVESSYRTAPFRILVGHSLGGLFAVHSFVTDPDLFQGTLAISPSLWWDEGRSVEQMGALLEARPNLSSRIFLTLGNEGGDMLEQFHNLETLLRYKAPPSLSWQAEVTDTEDHASIPIPSVHDGLRFFFPRWRVPAFVRDGGLAAADRHFASLSKDYGYPITTPETLINNLGYRALGGGDLEEAIELFRTNVARYPTSANVYDSLGEAVEAQGDLQEALKLYSKAYELGQGRDDANLSTYGQHRDAVQEKLDAAQ